jgi:hypothetical protein
MNQCQQVIFNTPTLTNLEIQAQEIARQKIERANKSRQDRRIQIDRALIALQTKVTATTSYSQRLKAFTDR